MGKQLSIVGTPIGNLGDMTPRARKALEEADLIFCEDTRVTGKLLSALGIDGSHAKLRRLDENLLGSGGAVAVLDALRAGMHVAYCSDAGMPCISDPGQRLVESVQAEGFSVEVIPGPTAVSSAIAASGIEAIPYYFGGFLPRKDGERKRLLVSLADLDAALVFYESPKRLAASLQAISATFPFREVAVCRELTKLHEEVISGIAPDVFAKFEASGSPKGEIVIVIGKSGREEVEKKSIYSLDETSRFSRRLLDAGVSRKDAVELLRDAFGVSRNDAYKIVHSKM